MVKFIGSLLIIVACTYIGFLYGDNLKNRVLQLKELEKSIYLLKNEMFYTYTSLPEALRSVSEKSKYIVKDVFLNVSQVLYEREVENVYDAFRTSINKEKNNIKLNEEDIDILLNLTKSLGISDLEGQKSIFSLTIHNLDKQIESAESIMKKNMKVYRYLGFSLGTMIVIMLL